MNANKEKPLVSVILPTYNRLDYLREAVASAINQTYKEIEIIVSDNCSPINPQSVLESFNDPRIKFYRQVSNVGPFLNITSAFMKAQGKYIACLLDDDLWENNYLSEMIPVLENDQEAVIAFCDHYMANENGEINLAKTEECSKFYGRKTLSQGLHKPFYHLAIVSQAVSPAFAAVMRRDAIDWKALTPDVGLLWDTYLAYLYSCTGRGAYYIPARLTRCREHEQTITKQSGSQNVDLKLEKAEGDIFCCEAYLADKRLASLRPHFQKKLAHHLTTSGIALMKKGRRREARHRFWCSLKTSPKFRTVSALGLSFLPDILICYFERLPLKRHWLHV
ncbi:MAG: glycosyl transferase [Leptolyngbya sp.]|nr:MAG: glycosyl transferase [Leptolyngbya sp.]